MTSHPCLYTNKCQHFSSLASFRIYILKFKIPDFFLFHLRRLETWNFHLWSSMASSFFHASMAFLNPRNHSGQTIATTTHLKVVDIWFPSGIVGNNNDYGGASGGCSWSVDHWSCSDKNVEQIIILCLNLGA